VFEKYYKQHLAKRLLSGRTVSDGECIKGSGAGDPGMHIACGAAVHCCCRMDILCVCAIILHQLIACAIRLNTTRCA
jgi:hypothetical protein